MPPVPLQRRGASDSCLQPRSAVGVGLAVLLVLLAGACSLPGEAPGQAGSTTRIGKPYTVNGVRYVPRAEPYYDRTGIASWYGGKFHGRRTASGHRYDMNSMTAAHKTLPLGARVKVTNLANWRAVILTINDRGPFAGNRVIDVSRRAAGELGFLRAGTADVRVQVVSPDRSDPPVQLAQARSEPSDAKHFLPVLNRAMEHGTRSSEFFWANPDTGRQGSIVPLSTPHETSRPFCRNYRRTAGDDPGAAIYIGRACREAGGSWRIVRERKTGS